MCLGESFGMPLVPSNPPLPLLGDFAHLRMSPTMNQMASLVREELAQTTIADLLERQPERLGFHECYCADVLRPSGENDM